MRASVPFVALIFTAAVALPVLAEAPAAKTVHFSSYARAGVESGCVVAAGDDGKTYNVTGTSAAGQWLQGTATVTNRVTTCMQGATIDNFVPDKEQEPESHGP